MMRLLLAIVLTLVITFVAMVVLTQLGARIGSVEIIVLLLATTLVMFALHRKRSQSVARR
ncbi:MAG: hypothetical protein ACRCYU_07090 [Nocardioides sp.]